MHFLLLLHVRVELGDAQQSELLHQVYLVGSLHVLVHECGHRARECGRVEHDLAVVRQKMHQTVQNTLEVLREQFVRLKPLE